MHDGRAEAICMDARLDDGATEETLTTSFIQQWGSEAATGSWWVECTQLLQALLHIEMSHIRI